MAGSEPSGEMRSRMAFIALLFTIFSTGSCSSQVPLVLWSSNGYTLPPLASLSAGHVMSSDQLVSYLNSALGSGPHNVLLFLQEKLSKDDFTMYGGVFGNKQDSAFPNLEAALHSSSSQLVVPALSWPGSIAVPALLQEKLGVSPLHVDPATLASVHLNASDNNLLVFNLPYPTGSHMSCKDVLSNNDEVIGKVLSVMKAQDVPYIAIYTGLRPSRVIEEMSMVGQSMGRSLLQESEETKIVKPPLMFNNSEGNPCIMLWAQTLNISFSMLPWFDLGPLTFNSSEIVSTDESTCTANSSRLVLNYGSLVPGYSTLILTFAMSQRFYPVSGRNWFTLDTVELQFNNETAVFNGSRGIYAPTNYSFHCQSVNSFRYPLLVNRAPTTTTNISLWRLNFIDFQIQGFGIVNGTNFSYANDCAGFFTPGIWMGLITSLLMLLILTYGLHMIMQVRTMDRFDDPKGPSISVPQSE